jgi:hypothetical protein
MKNLHQAACTGPIAVMSGEALTGYKAIVYNVMISKTLKEVMLIGEGDPGTKEASIHTRNAYLLVRVANPQLEVGNIIDLRAAMTH